MPPISKPQERKWLAFRKTKTKRIPKWPSNVPKSAKQQIHVRNQQSNISNSFKKHPNPCISYIYVFMACMVCLINVVFHQSLVTTPFCGAVTPDASSFLATAAASSKAWHSKGEASK